jgi:prepilin-type N-terminal cleavage/methylation domain-containing protein
MDKFKKAFTLVELIVTATIIAILWAIWFAAFVSNISDSRDAKRKSDLSLIMSSLKKFKTEKWYYVIPSDYFSITNNWNIIAWQWKLTKNTGLSTIDDIPYDPQLEIPYSYSFTINRQEYEIAWTFENWWEEKAILMWDYKSVSENVLPTIMLATGSVSSNVEINSWTTDWAENRKYFVFNDNTYNLVYSFENNWSPKATWTDFDALLNKAKQTWNFFQNSSFFTCDEIKEAWKSIWNWEYQIRSSTWALTNTGCTF